MPKKDFFLEPFAIYLHCLGDQLSDRNRLVGHPCTMLYIDAMLYIDLTIFEHIQQIQGK